MNINSGGDWSCIGKLGCVTIGSVESASVASFEITLEEFGHRPEGG